MRITNKEIKYHKEPFDHWIIEDFFDVGIAGVYLWRDI